MQNLQKNVTLIMMKLAAILSACVYTAVIETNIDANDDGDLEGLISQLENEEIEVIRSQKGDYFKLEKGQHFYENKEKKEMIFIIKILLNLGYRDVDGSFHI